MYSTSDDGKVSLFTSNVYTLKKKFRILKKLVDDTVQGKNLSESYLLTTGVEITVGSNDDLVPSDNEEDSDLDHEFDDVISDSDKDDDNDVIANLKTPPPPPKKKK